MLITIPVVLKRAEKVGFDNPEQQTKDFEPTTNNTSAYDKLVINYY